MYNNLNRLGVTIYSQPQPHVKLGELVSAIKQVGLSENTFHALFGSKTVLICEGLPGVRPADCEEVLKQMFESGKQRDQLLYG